MPIRYPPIGRVPAPRRKSATGVPGASAPGRTPPAVARSGAAVLRCRLADEQMPLKKPFLDQVRNHPRKSGDRDFRDNDLATFVVIRLARLQSRLNILREADRVNEQDRITAAVLAFQKCVDEPLTLHFPFVALREPFREHKPWDLAVQFHHSGP